MVTGKLDVDPQCPTCKALLNGFTSIGHDNPPEPGCLTVCAYCGEILRFNEHLFFKKVESFEYKEFSVGQLDILIEVQNHIKERNQKATKH